MRWKALLAIIGPWTHSLTKTFPLFVSFKYPWKWAYGKLDQWKRENELRNAAACIDPSIPPFYLDQTLFDRKFCLKFTFSSSSSSSSEVETKKS